MISLCEKEFCTGCWACFNACPTDSITMDCFQDSFLYPYIDTNSCIECRRCVKTCPILDTHAETSYSPDQQVLMAIPKDAEKSFESSSAGVAYALGRKMIEAGGCVLGAVYTRTPNELKVQHCVATSDRELTQQQGSKYVQSAIEMAYKKAEELLVSGTAVLFTGTPCQIDGLRHFLNTDYENLYTCDLLCAGVPSQKLFSKYIDYIEKKKGSKAFSVNFRSKHYGYGFGSLIAVSFADGHTKIFSHGPEAAISRCMDLGIKRPACFSCKYASLDRIGDISLGDFHKTDCSADDFEKGVSLVLINTRRGNALFESVVSNFKVEKKSSSDALASNRFALSLPRKKPANYREMLENISQHAWVEYYNQFLSHSGIKKAFIRLMPPRLMALIRRARRRARQGK